uniref:Uncharacterized protein n=1 Tax=Rhizophora mucronata TaxID=61149 RepID=A0A2P2INT6_RHIMU
MVLCNRGSMRLNGVCTKIYLPHSPLKVTQEILKWVIPPPCHFTHSLQNNCQIL